MGPLAGRIARVVATGTKHIWQQDVSDEDIAIATAVVCVITQVKAVGVALCAMCEGCCCNDGFSRSVDGSASAAGGLLDLVLAPGHSAAYLSSQQNRHNITLYWLQIVEVVVEVIIEAESMYIFMKSYVHQAQPNQTQSLNR